jgi:hypothetical protein
VVDYNPMSMMLSGYCETQASHGTVSKCTMYAVRAVNEKGRATEYNFDIEAASRRSTITLRPPPQMVLFARSARDIDEDDEWHISPVHNMNYLAVINTNDSAVKGRELQLATRYDADKIQRVEALYCRETEKAYIEEYAHKIVYRAMAETGSTLILPLVGTDPTNPWSNFAAFYTASIPVAIRKMYLDALPSDLNILTKPAIPVIPGIGGTAVPAAQPPGTPMTPAVTTVISPAAAPATVGPGASPMMTGARGSNMRAITPEDAVFVCGAHLHFLLFFNTQAYFADKVSARFMELLVDRRVGWFNKNLMEIVEILSSRRADFKSVVVVYVGFVPYTTKLWLPSMEFYRAWQACGEPEIGEIHDRILGFIEAGNALVPSQRWKKVCKALEGDTVTSW